MRGAVGKRLAMSEIQQGTSQIALLPGDTRQSCEAAATHEMVDDGLGLVVACMACADAFGVLRAGYPPQKCVAGAPRSVFHRAPLAPRQLAHVDSLDNTVQPEVRREVGHPCGVRSAGRAAHTM